MPNIVEVVHDRLSSIINAGSAGVTLSLETQGKEYANQLIDKFREKKHSVQIININKCS